MTRRVPDDGPDTVDSDVSIDEWVVVTGASRGIGRAVVDRLHAAGWGVIGVARDEQRLDAVASEIGRGAFEPAVCDLADADAVTAFWDGLRDRGIPLAGLVNNAAIAPHGRAEDTSLEVVRQVLEVNVRAVFQCCVGAYRLLRARGGSIVNITSIEARVGLARMAPYCASKFAVQGLTQSLAVEWAPDGVRVNAVAPGPVATDMTAELSGDGGDYLRRRTPMRRFADASEISGAVAYLLSAEASYVTGSEIVVDGGFTA